MRRKAGYGEFPHEPLNQVVVVRTGWTLVRLGGFTEVQAMNPSAVKLPKGAMSGSLPANRRFHCRDGVAIDRGQDWVLLSIDQRNEGIGGR
jgi:hypothetical protein